MKPEQSLPRATRFIADLSASVDLAGRSIACRAYNLSRTGALLAGDFPRPAPDAVQIVLSGPGEDLRLAIVGRVVRVSQPPDGEGTLLAVEFNAVSDADRMTLEAIIARVVEGVAPSGLAELPERAGPEEIRAALERVPLPHRMALAARAQRRERELLLHDPHLQVLDALARNPSLLRHEVLALVRMPGLLPHTLDVIGRDARWRANEQIQVLVATHRNTTLPVAEALIARMTPLTRKKVLRASDLKPALRAKLLR